MTDERMDGADWLAWRYVAGELTEEEARAFERQLADEQPARESVAEAVELWQAIAAAAQPPCVAPVMPASVWDRIRRPAGWISVGAAACLALVLGIQTISPPANDMAGNDPAATELALAWVETSALVQPDEARPASELSFDELLASLEVEPPSGADGEFTAAPSWMVAAVVGTADRLPVEMEN